MSNTVNAVPESISRADYVRLIASIGLDAKDLFSLTFGTHSIEAVSFVLDEDGKRVVDQRLCEPALYLKRTITITVADEMEADHA